MTDAFREARERVTALEAGEHYGMEVDRHGRALCPFHNDRHPSMTFKGGRFRCWSCGASGTSIDLTAQLLGLAPAEAVKQLNADFSLDLHFDREPTAAEKKEAQRRREVREAHRAFEEWRERFLRALCAAIRRANTLEIIDLDKLTEQEAAALRMRAVFEYLADTLEAGTPREQAAIYRERGQIARWIEKVLNPS